MTWARFMLGLGLVARVTVFMADFLEYGCWWISLGRFKIVQGHQDPDLKQIIRIKSNQFLQTQTMANKGKK